MFTIKLYKGHAQKIIEAKMVDIFPVGPAHPDSNDSKPSTSVLEISIDGGEKAFYVADSTKPRPSNLGPEIDLYDTAYIENAVGATTHKVKPY